MNREELAKAVHNIWSHWMRHMFSQGEVNSFNGQWEMPSGSLRRWTRQMKTEYADLSESEKNSGRKIVDEFFNKLLEEEKEWTIKLSINITPTN